MLVVCLHRDFTDIGCNGGPLSPNLSSDAPPMPLAFVANAPHTSGALRPTAPSSSSGNNTSRCQPPHHQLNTTAITLNTNTLQGSLYIPKLQLFVPAKMLKTHRGPSPISPNAPSCVLSPAPSAPGPARRLGLSIKSNCHRAYTTTPRQSTRIRIADRPISCREGHHLQIKKNRTQIERVYD
jgi:hypothetical protein